MQIYTCAIRVGGHWPYNGCWAQQASEDWMDRLRFGGGGSSFLSSPLHLYSVAGRVLTLTQRSTLLGGGPCTISLYLALLPLARKQGDFWQMANKTTNIFLESVVLGTALLRGALGLPRARS